MMKHNESVSKDMEHQFSYHIIPFSFKKTLDDELIKQVKISTVIKNKANIEKEVLIWEELDLKGNQRIFSHVDHLICSDAAYKERIAVKYKVNDNARAALGLPSASDKQVEYENKSNQVKFRFYIKSVELYLFETQVGFLCFDIRYDHSFLAQEIIDANYWLKNVSQNAEHLALVKRVKNEDPLVNEKNKKEPENLYTESIERFEYEESIHSMIGGLGPVSFYEGKNGLPKQALVFSSLCLKTDPNDEIIKKYLFQMRRLFKDTYKPSEREFNLESNQEVIRSFANSYWGASAEGCANICYLVDDEKTNTFLKSTYRGNVTTTYLYLYILVIHQKYALLNFSAEASLIEGKAVFKSETEIKETIQSIKFLQARIASFYLRCHFLNVSNITHQNEIYDMLMRTLCIDKFIKEIDFELAAISRILKQQEDLLRAVREEESRIKEKEAAKKQTRFNTFITVLSTVFLVSQAISFTYDIAVVALNCSMLTFSVISIFIFLIGIIGMLYFIRDWYKAGKAEGES